MVLCYSSLTTLRQLTMSNKEKERERENGVRMEGRKQIKNGGEQ